MKPLTIEIHGTGTHNRGAELMAYAISESIREFYPQARIAVPYTFGSFQSRAKHGFWTIWEFPGRFRTKFVGNLLCHGTPTVPGIIGIVHPSEIDVVIDASGFAFSDQWGPEPARLLCEKMNGPARAGKPLLLMPQAFGPFSNPEVSYWTAKLTERAALVCARDSRSYSELVQLGSPNKTRLFRKICG